MKKLKTLFMTMLCMLLSLTAWAQEEVTVTVNVHIDNNPEVCCVLDANYQEVELQKGDNVFTVVAVDYGWGARASLQLQIKDEYEANWGISAMKYGMSADEAEDYQNFYGLSSYAYITVTPEVDGYTFFPTIANLDDLRTATAKVTVEDASKVSLTCQRYEPVLVNGENFIKFNPDAEYNWCIAPARDVKAIGGVKRNGETVRTDGSAFYLYNMTDGEEVEIITTFDDTPVPVTFTFADEESKGFITKVSIVSGDNLVDVQNWAAGFEVAPYTSLVFRIDDVKYGCDEFTVNGEPMYYLYDNMGISITEATEIYVKAHEYTTFDVDFDITEPAHLELRLSDGNWSSTELTGLVAGVQTVNVSEQMPFLSVSVKNGYFLDEISYINKEGETVFPEQTWSGYSIDLREAAKVIVKTHAPVREDAITLWVDGFPEFNDPWSSPSVSLEANGYVTLASLNSREAPETITDGYQTVMIDAENDNPLSFSYYFGEGTPNKLYVNSEEAVPAWEGASMWQFSVNAGDVIRVYIASEPVMGSVQLDLGSLEADDVEVVLDYTYKMKKLPKKFNALVGTRVCVKSDKLKCLVVDGVHTGCIDGECVFHVTGDNVVKCEAYSPFKGVSVAAGEEYFLYNVGTGKWLADNSVAREHWTSRAQLTDYGFDVALTANGDGWTINPKLGNNHSLNGNNLYMDTNDAVTKWMFTPSEDGVSNGYVISWEGKKLGADDAGLITNDALINTTWQIVTAEERLARMLKAGETQPVDASWMIKGREFPIADERIGAWKREGLTGSAITGWNGDGDWFVRCNGVMEAWGLDNANFCQTINVPNGVYSFRASAFYSPTATGGTNATDYADYKERGEETVAAYIYANDVRTKTPSIYGMCSDEWKWGYAKTIVEGECYIPANVHEASYAVYFGGYQTDEVKVVVTDGKLTIGICTENAGGNGYFLFDKPVLTYLSPIDGVNEIQEGKFYLYNIETGKWLGGNTEQASDWHTRVQLNASGLDFNLVKNGEGWSLDPDYFCDGNIDANDAYLDHHGDNVKAPWYLDEVEIEGYAHAFTISSDRIVFGINANTQLLTYDNNPAQVAHFILVSPEERVELMKKGTEDEPVDATWLIRGYDLSAGTPRTDAWTLTVGGENDPDSGWLNHQRGQVRETWRWSTMDFSQRVKLPDGRYRLYTHACYVPTEGRAMNEEDLYDYFNRGSETVYAELYAGNAGVKVPSIYSEAKDGVTDGFWKNIAGYGLPNGVGDVAWDFFHGYDGENWFEGYYASEPLEFSAVGGEVNLGIRSVEGAPNTSWIMIGDFRLEYIGELTGVEAYRNELEKAVAAAEEYMSSDFYTTTVLISALNEAHMAGLSLLVTDCEDVELLGAAATAIYDAIAACKAVDTKALYEVLEWVYETAGNEEYVEYVNNILEVEDAPECAFVVAYGIAEIGTTQAEVDAAVRALKLEYKQFVASKSEMPAQWSMPSQSVVGVDDNTPATYVNDIEDGYYVYNVGTGRWFCGGDDWGAHAAVGFPGIVITTPENNWGDGHYNSVYTWLCNGNWGQSAQLGNNGYADTGGNAWKFWQKDPELGIYTWSNNGSNTGDNSSNGCGTKDLVGFNADTYMRVDVHQADDNNPYNQWMFVTKAQRLAALEGATEMEPVDATFMIGMPGFNQRERLAGTNQDGDERLAWNCNHENYTYDNEKYNYNDIGAHRHIIFERAANHPDFCVDVYGPQYGDVFTLSQTVEGLPAGYYMVMVQGYVKGEQQGEAFLNANDASVALRGIESDVLIPWNNNGGYPDNTWQAIEAFQNGLYWNKVIAKVAENGKLDISVTKETAGNDYNILFDNFRLLYLGTDISTGVTEVNAVENTSDAVYTISGMKVEGKLQKGLYIINGQKKVVK